jgi:hypothetical protein
MKIITESGLLRGSMAAEQAAAAVEEEAAAAGR